MADSKYYFEFNTYTLDFGAVDINSAGMSSTNTIITKDLIITNSSDYILNFKVEFFDVETPYDKDVFEVSNTSSDWTTFSVSPNSTFTNKVTFKPRDPKKYTNQSLVFSWNAFKETTKVEESITPITISLVGTGVIPIRLDKNYVNFNTVLLNKSVSDTITILNETNINLEFSAELNSTDVNYSIDTDDILFNIESKETKEITINYTPKSVGNHKNSIILRVRNNEIYKKYPITVNLQGEAETSFIKVNTQSIDFGNKEIYEKTAKEIIITNTSSNVELDVTTVLDSSVYTLSSRSFTVHPDESYKLGISFKPLDYILYEENLVINSSNNSPITVKLTGTGVGKNTKIDAPTDEETSEYYLDYGRIGINNSKSIPITITNTSTTQNLVISNISVSNGFSYKISNTTIIEESTAILTVYFNPTTTEEYSGTISFISNGITSKPTEVNLYGEGFITPVISVNSTEIDFGKNAIGETYNKSVTIRNTGLETLWVSKVESSFRFGVVVTPSSENLPIGILFKIKKGESYNLVTTYTPYKAGNETGTITLYCNIYGDYTNNTQYVFTTKGEALATPISIDVNEIDFGDILIGNTSEKSFKITNKSSNSITLDSITSTNDSFSITTNLPLDVPSSQTSTIKIKYTATHIGNQTSVLTLHEDTLGILSPTISLKAKTIYPIIEVLPSFLSYDRVAVNKTNENTITIKNSGEGKLVISKIESTSPYYTVGSFNANLNPSAELTVKISFKPEIPYLLTGNIIITSNDPNNPTITIGVSGTGVIPPGYDIYSFENAEEEDLPYTVNVQPILYRWSLLNIEKDLSYFEIPYDNRLVLFEAGQIIAVKSRITGDIYFHMISGYSIEDLEQANDKKKTKINIKDTFRINFMDPYMYKYNSPIWNIISESYTINTEENTITISGNVSGKVKKSHLISFQDTYIYKVSSVEVVGTSTIVSLSPSFVSDHRQSYSGNIKVSDVPVYIDEATRQPQLVIAYNSAEFYATVKIDDDNISLCEYRVGYVNPENTTELVLKSYNNINNLVEAIRNIDSVLFSGKAFTVYNYYENIFTEGGSNKFRLIPTYGTAQLMPYTIYVEQATFEVRYTVPPTYDSDSYAEIELGSGVMLLKEVLYKNKVSIPPQTYTINYSNFNTIYDIISYINNIQSTISGLKSFSVVEYTGNFSPNLFFEKGLRGTFLIPSFAESRQDKLPQAIPAIVYPEAFTLLGPLNKRKLVLDEDYTVENGDLTLTAPINRLDRFSLNYMGLDNLAEEENNDINVFCRFFSSLPVNSKVITYMDYLNIDQFYIQKLTERKFLEIVTAPQIKQLIEQKSSGGGIGNNTGGNPQPKNYEGGANPLYYQLRDEQIKQMLYLKIFKWYKRRLRFFAAEAQLILGFKFGHSTHYYADYPKDASGRVYTYDYLTGYTLDDEKVEGQIDYEMTKKEDLESVQEGSNSKAVDRGFNKFFPIGYEGTAPKYYDRFGKEYLNYTSCFCYNIRYLDEKNPNGKPKIQGYVRSYKPYWGGRDASGVSDLDYKILKNASDSLVPNIRVPFDASETTYSVDDPVFSFLKRVEVGDSVKINGSDTYYKIGSILPPTKKSTTVNISNRKNSPTTTIQDLAETIVLEDGKYFKEKNVPTYNIGKYGGPPTGTSVPSYRTLIRKKLFSNPPSGSIEIKIRGKRYYVSYTPMEDFVSKLGTENFKMYIKRQSAEQFPVYNDEGNYGVTAVSNAIRGHIKNTNRIRKFSLSDFLQLLFPGLIEEPDKNFKMNVGTYDEDDGKFRQGVFNDATNGFTEDTTLYADEDDANSKSPKGEPVVNLKKLTFFEERRVSDTMEAILRDMENVGEVPAPLLPISKIDIYKVYPKYSSYGLHSFFNINFERSYDYKDSDGYVDALIFRTINRDSWFVFRKTDDEDVTDDYGVLTLDTTEDNIDAASAINNPNYLYKGFYDPRSLYQKLVLEKQAWLTEEEIIHKIYDVQLKMARAFSEKSLYTVGGAILNTGSKIVGSVNSNIEYSIYRSYLLQIGEILRIRMNKYLNLIRFLVSSDPNNMGPVVSILQEDSASAAIIDSYNKTLAAYKRYTDFVAKTFDNPDSFFNINEYDLNVWNNDYIRWVLSLTEGVIFQKQARQHIRNSSVITFGVEYLNAISINYDSSGTTHTITEPKTTITYDYNSNSLTLILTCKYKSTVDAKIKGDFVLNIPFITYTTLGSLVDRINNYVYPDKGKFFSASVLFEYYPTRGYACSRLEQIATTTIPKTGITLRATNYADHRQHDARILYLTKGVTDALSVTNSTSVEVFPQYVSYYNNPLDSNYSNTLNPRKSAIQGLKVPGKWRNLDDSQYNVFNLEPFTGNYELYYTFVDVYDNETPVSNYDEKILIPEQVIVDSNGNKTQIGLAVDAVNEYRKEKAPGGYVDRSCKEILKDIIVKIKIQEDLRKKEISDITKIIDAGGLVTQQERDLLAAVDYGSKPGSIIVKTLTLVLKDKSDGKTKQINIDTRVYRTINDLVKVLNGYFVVNSNGIWVPSTPKTTGSVRWLKASLLGDENIQGQMSSFELDLSYTQSFKSFYYEIKEKVLAVNYEIFNPLNTINPENLVIPPVPLEEEYKITYPYQDAFFIGWIPEYSQEKAVTDKPITFKVKSEPFYSYGNTYWFEPLSGAAARSESITINKGKTNADILPFDLYCIESGYDPNTIGGYYEISNNILYISVTSLGVNRHSIPLKEDETIKELVDRINDDAVINKIIYANLKFAREGVTKEDDIGYFEYTYLPSIGTTPIYRTAPKPIYLKPDDNVISLNGSNVIDAEYEIKSVDGESTELDLKGRVKIFSIKKTNGYTLTNPTYSVSGGNFTLTTDYLYTYKYEHRFNLYTTSNLSTLRSEILALEDPILSQPLFNVVLSGGGTLPCTTLEEQTQETIPITLHTKSTPVYEFYIEKETPTGAISYGDGLCTVTSSELILTLYINYTGTALTESIPLTNTISDIVDAANQIYPYGNSSIFNPVYELEIVRSYYEDSTGDILDTTVTPQPISGVVYTSCYNTMTYIMSGSIKDLYDIVNADTKVTGFYIEYLFSDDPGYRNLDAKYLNDTAGVSIPFSVVSIGAKFTDVVALYVAALEKSISVSADGNKFIAGTYSINLPVDKNIHKWVNNNKGTWFSGLKSSDILLIKVDDVPYGVLFGTASISSVESRPTHVYFGILGDMRFYQISDINLYNQLSIIKKRLAEPWKDNGKLIKEEDPYNHEDFYDSSVGNASVVNDGNLQAIYKDKFLTFLKYGRFKDIKDSISGEQLINNKYLWLYLKLNREIGCDQKVKALTKKIKEDETDKSNLPGDLS